MNINVKSHPPAPPKKHVKRSENSVEVSTKLQEHSVLTPQLCGIVRLCSKRLELLLNPAHSFLDSFFFFSFSNFLSCARELESLAPVLLVCLVVELLRRGGSGDLCVFAGGRLSRLV